MKSRIVSCIALMMVLGSPCATAPKPGQPGWSGIDCLVVEKATIQRRDLKPEKDFGMANVGHQIIHGENLVLAIRAWKGFMDGQQFTKATLEFAPPDRTLIRDTPQPIKVLHSYFSEGSAGFVADGLYTWAENPFSRFQVIVSGLTAEVRVNAMIEAHWFNNGEKRRLPIVWSCSVQPRFVWQLDEWEGKAGTGWTSFSRHPGALIIR